MIHTLVQDWMTKDPVTVKPDTTITEAYHLMVAQGIRRLPVVDNGRLVGIVTLSDLYKVRPFDQADESSLELSQHLNNMIVEEVMAPQPITVQNGATVGEAAQLMLDYKISGLPVVSPTGRLVGIITESDIFRLVVQEWSTRKHGSLHLPRKSTQG
jgi:acetoin utilization protein AcuB